LTNLLLNGTRQERRGYQPECERVGGQSIGEPTVSVIMPVYNTAEYLVEAIESILSQSLRDFEFIIIDDGSTDASGEILGRYKDIDSRIRVERQENSGIVMALNKGMKMATGKYIARMDSDDISLPERLARQVAFMESHPEVGVCGTACRLFGGSAGVSWTTTDPEEIKSRLLFWPCMSHPTVMMRRDVVVKENLYYKPDFKMAEDYELWVRFSQYAQLANLPEVLLLYRIRGNQITSMFDSEVTTRASLVQKQALATLGIEPSDAEMELHLSLHRSSFERSQDYVKRVDAWLCRILVANLDRRTYDRNALAADLFERWVAVCSAEYELGLWVLREFKGSALYAPGRRASHWSGASLAWRFARGLLSGKLQSTRPGRLVKRTVRNVVSNYSRRRAIDKSIT
jgi:glycosyltransferase involved in cell wall biosynthesis